MLRDRKNGVALLQFVLLSLLCFLFCYKLLKNFHYWGVSDWDQHLFYLESPIRVLKTYGQLPLWNPWYQGGMVLFQNPQVILLTPFTLLLLFLDTPEAIKVSIVLHYVIALLGVSDRPYGSIP